jgi:hypothetical protein
MKSSNYLLNFAPGFIRLLGEIAQEFKEIRCLPDEKAIVAETFYSSHGDSLGGCRPDNRADRKFLAEEYSRLGHDQVGL